MQFDLRVDSAFPLFGHRRNGRVITFAYDNFDRQTTENWYSSAGTAMTTPTS
ncbi:MAG: hypothetical protein FWD31_10730 [Planctomycetaceae bacterium]|nr:hypothetical protein [Planctomycetaceae bacterium]